mmetsp:Transcript_33138/g.78295  ORF Transcript_33138/g.78295 Transcript_33138/m.78295 type:complete len:119 (-) Transcript_33138:293-649(-)
MNMDMIMERARTTTTDIATVMITENAKDMIMDTITRKRRARGMTMGTTMESVRVTTTSTMNTAMNTAMNTRKKQVTTIMDTITAMDTGIATDMTTGTAILTRRNLQIQWNSTGTFRNR